MNHRDEIALHLRDRAAWIAYVAQGMARSLMLLDDEGMVRCVRCMGEDYREAVKSHLSTDEYARVKKAIATATGKRDEFTRRKA